MSDLSRKITDRKEMIEYIMQRFGYSLEEATKNVEDRLGPEEKNND